MNHLHSVARGSLRGTRVARARLARQSLILRSSPHGSPTLLRRWVSTVLITSLPHTVTQLEGRRHSSSSFNHNIVPEEILLENITIEVDLDDSPSTHSSHTATHSHSSGRSGGDSGAETKQASAHGYQDVTRVDPFSRSRVTNYLRRMGHTSKKIFHTSVVRLSSGHGDSSNNREDGSNTCYYHATCRIPLPEPHRSHVAEGLAASSEKDAELLAAMHAEAICDTLGVPLFQLASSQQKHAETARRVWGRYAPLPGEPVKPEGTPVPPPFRMMPLSLLHSQGSSSPAHQPQRHHSGQEMDAKESHQLHRIFSARIAEAVVVEAGETSNHGSVSAAAAAATSVGVDREATPLESMPSCDKATVHAAAGAARHGGGEGGGAAAGKKEEEEVAPPSERILAFRRQIVFPWAATGATSPSRVDIDSNESEESGNSSSSKPAIPRDRYYPGDFYQGIISSTSAASSNSMITKSTVPFDPTEGRAWEMVITQSTRCSSSPHALALPCIYDGEGSYQRLTDYFLQQHLRLRDSVSYTHVSVPGHSTRMYQAELRLPTAGTITARGKAQTKEMALRLAAMHAELLLDALGHPLFPGDAARQALHAAAVKGFGRWAPDPVAGDVTPPHPHAPLPAPLKQHVGGDEVWLTGGFYSLSQGEQLVSLQHEVNFYCGDFIEANPPAALVAEARARLRRWQTQVAGNPQSELYIITRLGDFWRSTTLLPLPAHCGTRGGNAIGRTIEQAIDLCALHALDTLAALEGDGVPLCASEEEEREYRAQRRRLGLVAGEADVAGLVRPRGLRMTYWPTVMTREVFNRHYAANSNNSSSSSGSSSDEPLMVPRLYKPHLPGYIIEGSQERMLPLIEDTLHILQLHVPGDFDICGPLDTASGSTSSTGSATGSGGNESLLQRVGNEARQCVQNYIRHQHSLLRSFNRLLQQQQKGEGVKAKSRPASLTNSGSSSEAEAKRDHWEDELLSGLPPSPLAPSVYITGYGKQTSVYNIVYLRIPRPNPSLARYVASRSFTSSDISDGSEGRGSARKRNKKRKSLSRANATPGTAVTGESESEGESGEGTRAEQDEEKGGLHCEPTQYLLAVGLSLKKKDAERACYLHAAALLYNHGKGKDGSGDVNQDGSHRSVDVLAEYREGLPRVAATASYLESVAPLVTRTSSAEVDLSQPQRPFMSSLMKQFMDSERGFTPQKKRPPNTLF